MKKSSACLLLLFCFSGMATARTAYVTDSFDIPLRSGPTERSKIVKMLPNGAPLSVFQDSSEGDYAYVQSSAGVEGFILNRFLSNEPSSRSQLETISKKLETLQEENKQLKSSQSISADIGKERDKLSTELTELQQTAANAIQLKQQRDQLQEKVVGMERELQQLKRDNQTLTDNTQAQWFGIGGAVSIFSAILGVILYKSSGRRRSSGWSSDSF